MTNFSNHNLGFGCFTIGKNFVSFVSFHFRVSIANWGTCTLFRVGKNGTAPLILKIESQVMLTIYILKTFLLQHVSHKLYQKVWRILIANIYLTVTIIITKISS